MVATWWVRRGSSGRLYIQEWNQAQVEAVLLQEEVTWCFNAPSASHSGGAWERLIRSTQRILLGPTKEQVYDDGLSTLLAEVESVSTAVLSPKALVTLKT